MRSEDAFGDDLTGEVPVVSPSDSRVTISGADLASELVEGPLVDPVTQLPHWTEAPTGQVPIVVAREAAEGDDPWAAIPAPAWREGEADWVAHEDQFDASLLATDAKPDSSWSIATPDVEAEAILDETPRPEPQREFRTRRVRNIDPLAGRAARKSARSVSTATVTGLIMGAVALVLFDIGRLPVLAVVLTALALAAGEAYAAYRSVGAHPATILGIAGTVLVGLCAYQSGPGAIGVVSVLMLVFGFVWYLNAERQIDVMDGLGATIFVYVWVGVFGSYGALLLSPHTFANGHGVTITLGVVVLTAANDSGALFIGRAFGKRPLNQTLSPNKTIEGTLGGTLCSLVAGAIILPFMSPWSFGHGVLMALALSVVVPMGDLFESMVKRTLGVKDIGHLLPGHGGVLDRIDGLLFALPTAYYLALVFKLG